MCRLSGVPVPPATSPWLGTPPPFWRRGVTSSSPYCRWCPANCGVCALLAGVLFSGYGEAEHQKKACMRDGGCALVDWLRLNLELARITGRSRYLAMSERVLLNHLLHNQTENGGFGHRPGADEGIRGRGTGTAFCVLLQQNRTFRNPFTAPWVRSST